MDCSICFNKYDTEKYKPFSITPCGHCFCLHCLNSLQNQVCPIDRKPIENKIINRGILDLISSSDSNKSKCVLQQLKNSMIKEMKKLEKEMMSTCDSQIKKLEAMANSIKAEIEMDKMAKIERLERDSSVLIEKVDEIKKNLSKQCSDQVNANLFLQIIKSGHKLVQESQSQKTAIENSENLKKQIGQKIKNISEISFAFSSNSKLLSENLLGSIIEKKIPIVRYYRSEALLNCVIYKHHYFKGSTLVVSMLNSSSKQATMVKLKFIQTFIVKCIKKIFKVYSAL